jgi:uncharacterized protein (TIGR00251 family)
MSIQERIKSSRYLKIVVKPNSNKNNILSYDDDKDELKMEIAAPAEDNKANIEIIKFFTKLTGKKVRIKSGLTSRKKLIEFR